MLVKVVFVFLVILCSVVGPSSTQKKKACTKLSIRKEWRAFNAQEKATWIRAVKCLSHIPHDPGLRPNVDSSTSISPVDASSSYYDDVVYILTDLKTRIHFTGQFLPWHRWYVYAHEQALKNKCGYTGVSPYWNWTIDASEIFESSFWKDSPHTLRRNFTLLPFESPPVAFFTGPLKEANSSSLAPEIGKRLMTQAGDYKGFQAAFETSEGALDRVR